jgi:hypothetical protein
MIRYNAEHPVQKRHFFRTCQTANPSILAYTATSWRRLLKAPKGWPGADDDRWRLLSLSTLEPARGRGADWARPRVLKWNRI